MDWTTAWQLAGEVCDLLAEDEIETTARQHERIANKLQSRAGQKFVSHSQQWVSIGDENARLEKQIARARSLLLRGGPFVPSDAPWRKEANEWLLANPPTRPANRT